MNDGCRKWPTNCKVDLALHTTVKTTDREMDGKMPRALKIQRSYRDP